MGLIAHNSSEGTHSSFCRRGPLCYVTDIPIPRLDTQILHDQATAQCLGPARILTITPPLPLEAPRLPLPLPTSILSNDIPDSANVFSVVRLIDPHAFCEITPNSCSRNRRTSSVCMDSTLPHVSKTVWDISRARLQLPFAVSYSVSIRLASRSSFPL